MSLLHWVVEWHGIRCAAYKERTLDSRLERRGRLVWFERVASQASRQTVLVDSCFFVVVSQTMLRYPNLEQLALAASHLLHLVFLSFSELCSLCCC